MIDEPLLEHIKSLLHMHSQGLLGGEIMPEDALINVISDDELLNVLTLGMSLNYQRDSYALWRSIVQAYMDDSTKWIFNPYTVSTSNIEDLHQALLHYRVALQSNRHPEIWKRVSEGITQSSITKDVLGLIESAEYDIAILKNIIQVKRKMEFPYLSGPKLFNYWLYVMENYGGIKWKSRELITIAPDTHILKATVKLGLCASDVLNGTTKDRQLVSEAWKKALMDSGVAPIDVHTPLWLWSRAGFPALQVPEGR
ncbi:hypothetical protein [Priestia taiwanensis]|uniref:Uncharacterized protein n=1 Tax=Priestia taiwanensis TaxID=1347902 RepID=A0A917ALV0_9BACI|nr:hypothetical protein [Priestia taiwanensis]MBM7362199.1 hypothetical protein [Priestia taiwanensis]GGE60177.1 hypothetical protein GCM10007140_08210 [Priestia taiwanensis]